MNSIWLKLCPRPGGSRPRTPSRSGAEAYRWTASIGMARESKIGGGSLKWIANKSACSVLVRMDKTTQRSESPGGVKDTSIASQKQEESQTASERKFFNLFGWKNWFSPRKMLLFWLKIMRKLAFLICFKMNSKLLNIFC